MNAPTLNARWIPAPGSPWRQIPDPDDAPAPVLGNAALPPVAIWHLEARERVGKCLRWKPDGTIASQPLTTPYRWRWYAKTVPHGDVEALCELVEAAGRFGKTVLTTGTAVNPGPFGGSGRRLKHARPDAPATFTEAAVPWLPIDVDTLELPGCDVVLAPEIAVARAVALLGPAFADVSYVWQFSSSQRPDSEKIRLRLFFFTTDAVTNAERKRWAKSSPLAVDSNIYQAAGEIYVGAPLILSARGDPCPDWLPNRTGFFEGERDAVDLPVPPEPVRVSVAPPADGVLVRCPSALNPLAARIRQSIEGDRHRAIWTAGMLAGGYVAGGAITEAEAVSALLGLAIDSGSANAEKTLFDALQAGMQRPLVVGSGSANNPDTGLEDLPTATEATETLNAALTKFFDEAQAGAAPRLGVKGAAGLGKTTKALTMAHARGLTVDHFVPTIALALEQVDRLPAGAAIAIRGRTHAAKDLPPLCAKHEAADALQAGGFGRSQQRLLCGKPDAKGFPCPHADGCGYHAQFKSEATIRFYSHEWLAIGLSGDKPERAPDVAIVDEAFSKAFEDARQWRLAELTEEGGAFLVIGDAIRTGTLNKADHLPPILLALASRPPGVELPIHAGMSADKTILALRRWKEDHPEKRAPYEFLEYVKAALNNDETNRLYATVEEGATTIRYAGLKPLAASAPAWLFLDASLNPAMVAKVKPDTEIVTIEARRNVRVVQITDAALGKGRVLDNANHLSARLGEFAERLKATNPNGAVIGQKDFLKLATGNGHFKDLPDGHWPALRGLNTMETADWLLQIGRNEPQVWAVERSARCWFADDPDLKFGTVKRESAWLTAKDGTRQLIPALTTFGDSRCQAILEGMREQESLQGIDRLRLVHAAKPKTIYLLSNLPLPGVRPDVLTTLNQLLLPGRLAEVMKRDKAITGAAMLAKRHPDLFENPEQGKCALRALQWVDSLYRLLTGEIPIEGLITPVALVAQNYRTGKQAGGKPRRALLYENTAPAPLLTALHDGETVKLCEPADPAAQEEAAPVQNFAEVDPVVTEARIDRPPLPIAIPPGVGNIRWWLGCPFVADWETPDIVATVAGRTGGCRGHVVLNWTPADEARYCMWRIEFADRSATIVDPEPTTYSETWRYALSLTGATGISPIGAPA